MGEEEPEILENTLGNIWHCHKKGHREVSLARTIHEPWLTASASNGIMQEAAGRLIHVHGRLNIASSRKTRKPSDYRI